MSPSGKPRGPRLFYSNDYLGSVGVCHRYDFLVHLWNGLNFFKLFKLYFHLGLITTPHVFYDHMIYVYSLFLMFHLSHNHMAKRSHYRIMIFYQLQSSILQTHFHPHFLVPLPPPHPYTRHQYPRNTAPPGEEHATAPPYDAEEDLGNTVEDYVWPKLEPAKVRLVLPSNPSVQRVG